MHYPEIPERVGQLTRASIDLDVAAANGDVTAVNRQLIACKRLAARLGELHFCERHRLVPDEPNRYLDDDRTLELELEAPLDDPADRLRGDGWVQLDQDERGTVLEALAQEREALAEAPDGAIMTRTIRHSGNIDSAIAFVERLIAKLGGEPAPVIAEPASAPASDSDRDALRQAMTSGASVVVWTDDDDRDHQSPGYGGHVGWINDNEVRIFSERGSHVFALSRIARVMVDPDSEVVR